MAYRPGNGQLAMEATSAAGGDGGRAGGEGDSSLVAAQIK